MTYFTIQKSIVTNMDRYKNIGYVASIQIPGPLGPSMFTEHSGDVMVTKLNKMVKHKQNKSGLPTINTKSVILGKNL